MGTSRLIAAGLLFALSQLTFANPGDIENLGSFGTKYSQTVAYDINDAGTVVGNFTEETLAGPTKNRAFVRPVGGTIQMLADAQCDAYGINASGTMTGSMSGYGGTYQGAFLCSDTLAMQNAGITLGDGSWGQAINDANDIAGMIVYRPPSGSTTFHPFVRRHDGTVMDLGLPFGSTSAYGCGMNNNGDVVGWYDISSTARGSFIYRGSSGTFQSIDSLGFTSLQAMDINDAGDVVGYMNNTNGYTQPFLTSGRTGQTIALPLLPNGILGEAFSITDDGLISGFAYDSSGKHAVLWNAQGQIVNLDAWFDQVSPTAGAYWSLREARAINSSGMVVGSGYYDGGNTSTVGITRGFVLDASTAFAPEPSIGVLGLAGSAIVLAGIRKRAR